MQTAHQIVASFIAAKAIDMTDFNQWFEDGGYSQDEANIHDSRYLHLLETFVEERDAEHAAQPGTPAVQTKHEMIQAMTMGSST